MLKLNKKLNVGLFAAVLVAILLSQLSMTVSASNLESEVPSALQTTTETFEVIPDTSLQTGVELYTHGDSDEFSTSHDSIVGSVNLTWAHVAGTELQLTRLPDIWDFCYFTVSFNWLIEEVPQDAMFYVTYEIHITGDFDSTDGAQMFKVYSWLIDSSDDWEILLESESPYTTIAHQYSYDLNYFDLIPGWAGMVQNSEGSQEDPTDILQVGVGLAPTEDFETYSDGFPWQEYNGSVTVLVHALSLVVTMEIEDTSQITGFYYVAVPVAIFFVVAVVYLLRRRH